MPPPTGIIPPQDPPPPPPLPPPPLLTHSDIQSILYPPPPFQESILGPLPASNQDQGQTQSSPQRFKPLSSLAEAPSLMPTSHRPMTLAELDKTPPFFLAFPTIVVRLFSLFILHQPLAWPSCPKRKRRKKKQCIHGHTEGLD